MNRPDDRIREILRDSSLYMCLDCGKCSASCPRTLAGQADSPRLLALKLAYELEEETFKDNFIWDCLTCGLCEERCLSDVRFTRLILEMRTTLAVDQGLTGCPAHEGAPHSWMRMMTCPDLKQNRLDWLDQGLRIARSGPTAFFTGCAPYFDRFFAGIGVDTLSMPRAALRLLNFLNIEPVLLPDERCCGHDLLWTGDRKNFEALCRLNYELFKSAEVKEVIVSCPECYYVLARIMPDIIRGFDLKVILLFDFLVEQLPRKGLTFEPSRVRVTYQDPCRLGRMAGRYEGPRALLALLPDLDFSEMEDFGPGAACCGNSGFINCDAISKRIQVERLKEARKTGAELLLTACPKCMIHLTCAGRDPVQGNSLAIKIKDLTCLLAERLVLGDGKA